MAPLSISSAYFVSLFVLPYLLIAITHAFTTPGGAKRFAVRLGSPTSRPARLLSYFDDILGKQPEDGNETSSVSSSNLVPPSAKQIEASENMQQGKDTITNAAKIPKYSFLGIVTDYREEVLPPISASISEPIDMSPSASTSSDIGNEAITESKIKEKIGESESDRFSSIGSAAPASTDMATSFPVPPLPPPKPYGSELISYRDTVTTPGLNSYLDSVSAPPQKRYGTARQDAIIPPLNEAGSRLINYFDSLNRPSPPVPPPVASQSDILGKETIIQFNIEEENITSDSEESSSLESSSPHDINTSMGALPTPEEVSGSGTASDLDSVSPSLPDQNIKSEGTSSSDEGNESAVQSNIGEKVGSNSEEGSSLGSNDKPETARSTPTTLLPPEVIRISRSGTVSGVDSAITLLPAQIITSVATSSSDEGNEITIHSNVDEKVDGDSNQSSSMSLNYDTSAGTAAFAPEVLPTPEETFGSEKALDLKTVGPPLLDRNMTSQTVSSTDDGDTTSIQSNIDVKVDSDSDLFSSLGSNDDPNTSTEKYAPGTLPTPEGVSGSGTTSYLESVSTPSSNKSATTLAIDLFDGNAATLDFNIIETGGEMASAKQEGPGPSNSEQAPLELYLDPIGGQQSSKPSSYVDVHISAKTVSTGGRESNYFPQDTEQPFKTLTTSSDLPCDPTEGDMSTDESSESLRSEDVSIYDQDVAQDADTVGPKTTLYGSSVDLAAIEMEIKALEQMKAGNEGSQKKKFEWSKLRPRLPFRRKIDKPKSDRGLQEISAELINLQEEVVDTLSELVGAKEALLEQTKLETTISTLTDEKEQLQVGITELEGNLKDLGTEFDDLQQQVVATRSELNDAKIALVKQNESDSSAISKLREEKDQLGASVSDIKGDLKDLGNELLEVKDQISSSLAELSEAKQAANEIKRLREFTVATNFSMATTPAINSEQEGTEEGKIAPIEKSVDMTPDNSEASGIAANSSKATLRGTDRGGKAAPVEKRSMPTQNTEGLEQVEKAAGWLNVGTRLPFPSSTQGSDQLKTESGFDESEDEAKDVAATLPESSNASTTVESPSGLTIPSTESSWKGIPEERKATPAGDGVAVTLDNSGASGIAANSSKATLRGTDRGGKAAPVEKRSMPTQNTESLEQVEKAAGWLNVGTRLPFPSSTQGSDQLKTESGFDESEDEAKDVAATLPESSNASTTVESPSGSTIPSTDSSWKVIGKEGAEIASAEKKVAPEVATSSRASRTANSGVIMASTTTIPEGASELGKPAPAEKVSTATPTAQAAAEKSKIELANVKGTGKFGRVTVQDVELAMRKGKHLKSMASGKATSPSEVPKGFVPFTSMQRAIAKNMKNSLATPVFRVNLDIEMDKFDVLYQRLRLRVSGSTLLAKAVALAIEEHPIMNTSYSPDGGIVQHEDINIAMAVAVEGGLMAPTLRNANECSISELGASWRDLVRKARKGTLKPEEYQSSTFAITNMGMFGVTQFDPILPAGMGAILSIGSTRSVFVSDESEFIKARSVHKMTVTLTCDHRQIYGTDAANFLNTLDDILNNQLHRL